MHDQKIIPLAYTPPTTADLQRLKDSLNYSGQQMADMAGLGGSNQWRKYTGGAAPREANMHLLFFIAARLTMAPDDFERVLVRMREIGATVVPAADDQRTS